MSDSSWRKLQHVFDTLLIIGAPLLTVWILRRYMGNLHQPPSDPAIKNRLENILADRAEEEEDDYDSDEKPRETKTLTLNSYEQTIANEVIHPNEIPVTFNDIGGLDNIISDLQESVIYPLTLPYLYTKNSSLLSAPSGVLLYGPPGCGKTMLAKALARESGACFINLHISTLTEKWYGDSNKLVAAVFSLARKLAPCIVFIDEIDAVLGTRRSGDHEASGMVKAEFMTLWDGLTTGDQRIMILGATNRMQDIDDAILRRMPKRFAVGLPNAQQRKKIFKLVLKNTKIDHEVDSNGNKRTLDLNYLVKTSVGMSGSEIKEVCREAAMGPLREFLQKRRASGMSIKGARPEDLRGVRTEDFFQGTNSHVLGTRRSSNRKVVEPEDADFETTDEEGSAAEEEFKDTRQHDHFSTAEAAA